MIQRVLYASSEDPLDRDPPDGNSWSGTRHSIFIALSEVFEHVEPWRLPIPSRPLYERAQGFLSRRIYRSVDAPEAEQWFAKVCGRLIEDRLAREPFDAVFSDAPRIFGFVQGNTPAFAISDAVLTNLLGYYPEFNRIRPRTMRGLVDTERRGIARCRRFFVSSEWARVAAIEAYDLRAENVVLMPFGANMERLAPDELSATIRRRKTAPHRLLFLGLDWGRKGGDIAVEAVRLLNERGVEAVLEVVGCNPPPTVNELPYVRALGFLDKRIDADRAKLIRLLDEARFLLLPTRADAAPNVVAEAYCRAVPVAASAIGGIPSLVRHGVTGYLIPFEAGGAAYADAIQEGLSDGPGYDEMCMEAYQAANDQFNWSAIGRRLKEEMQQSLSQG